MRDYKFRVGLTNDLGTTFDIYTLENIGNIFTQSVFKISSIDEYTGLKDKNGKEIYEGDVVRLLTRSEYPTTCIVTWSKIEASFLLVYQPGNHGAEVMREKRVEVIGNIYEPPNLIKDKE